MELDIMIEMEKTRDYSCRMTHGDLSFRNIMMECKETSGWYPNYWEYAGT